MGTIVAIGGGELRDLETLPIDREIVRLTGRRAPRVLFVPTASGDAVTYWNTFNKVYGRKLGCRTDVLYLLRRGLRIEEIERSIMSAEAIYVGGGNTLRMMRRWRLFGVDRVMRRAYEEGIVLSGLSAGANCWFRYSTSDSRRFYDSTDERLIRVRGLGLVDAVVSPHHITEPNRDPGLVEVMRRTRGVGLALDDWAAIEIRDGEYRVLAARDGVGIRRVTVQRGVVVQERVERSSKYRPLEGLLEPAR